MDVSNLSEEQLEQVKRYYYKIKYTDTHKCNAPGSRLIRCCDKFRCSSCHVRHLNAQHSEGAKLAWFKGMSPQTAKPDPSIPLRNKDREKEKLDQKLQVLLRKMSPDELERIRRTLLDQLT